MQTFAHLHHPGVDELLVECIHLGQHLGAGELTSFRRIVGFHENQDSHTELLSIHSLPFGLKALKANIVHTDNLPEHSRGLSKLRAAAGWLRLSRSMAVMVLPGRDTRSRRQRP